MWPGIRRSWTPTTGELTTVGELFHRRRAFTIHALGTDDKLVDRPVTDVVWNGYRPVFELTTQSGRTITATDNHPMWTPEGWMLLGELAVGDEVGLAGPLLSVFTPKGWDNIAQGNALGCETRDLQSEGLRQANEAARCRTPSGCTNSRSPYPGRCPGLGCPTPSG